MNPESIVAATELAEFKNWFSANGGITHPSVELAYSHASGVYLRVKDEVTERLPTGTVVIRCPHILRLSSQDAITPLRPRADGCSYVALPPSIVATARPQTVNALWLSHQYLLGRQSPWYEYIHLLPRPPGESVPAEQQTHVGELETPVFWPTEDRDLIQNSNLWKGIHDLEGLWLEEWARLENEVSAWTASSGGPHISWGLFKWALATLGARAFTAAWFRHHSNSMTDATQYDPHMFLYPGIDLLNHHPKTKNKWICIEDSFCIRCDDEPRAGEEVFNWYGNKGNAELLLSYGFSIPGNPHDTFAIKLKERAYPLRDAVRQVTDPHYSRSNGQQQRQGSSLQNNDNNSDDSPTFAEDSKLIFKDVSLLRRPFHVASEPEPEPEPRPARTIHDQNLPLSRYDKHTPQFAGVPPALLSRLAETLANQREKSRVKNDPASFNAVYMFRELGRRVELRVTAVLLQMLAREHQKVKSIISALNNLGREAAVPVPVPAESNEEAYLGPRRRRQLFTRIYLDGQVEILTAITTALQTTLTHASAVPSSLSLASSSLASSSLPSSSLPSSSLPSSSSRIPEEHQRLQTNPSGSSIDNIDDDDDGDGDGYAHAQPAQRVIGKTLLRLDAAAGVFDRLLPPLADAYQEGIALLLSCSSAASVRANDCEEEVWAIWLQVLYIFLNNLHHNRDRDRGDAQSGSPAGHCHGASNSGSSGGGLLELQLRDWLAMLKRDYHLGSHLESGMRGGGKKAEHDGLRRRDNQTAEEEMDMDMQYVKYIQGLIQNIRSHTYQHQYHGERPKIRRPTRRRSKRRRINFEKEKEEEEEEEPLWAIWASPAWGDESLIRQCMRVIREEAFTIPLALDDNDSSPSRGNIDNTDNNIVGEEEMALYIHTGIFGSSVLD